jgi:hypothetical protein
MFTDANGALKSMRKVSKFDFVFFKEGYTIEQNSITMEV